MMYDFNIAQKLTWTDRWTDLVANGTKTADYQFVRQNTNYNSPGKSSMPVLGHELTEKQSPM
jgi:hypothetical protein